MDQKELVAMRKFPYASILFESSVKRNLEDIFEVPFSVSKSIDDGYIGKVTIIESSRYINRPVSMEEWKWTFPEVTSINEISHNHITLTIVGIKEGYESLYGWEDDKILDINEIINLTYRTALKVLNAGSRKLENQTSFDW